MMGPLRARTTLDDAKFAAQLFNDARESRARRVHWIATCALLRAIGHVLDRVDCEQDEIVAAAIKEHWTAIRAIERERHGIFWNFIEPERNAVLKTYEFGFDDSDLARLESVPDGVSARREPNLSYMPALADGYDGADARELIREALSWWEFQLVRIEQLIADNWMRTQRD
jgi:hypothetical protein